jgi:hypothetical protein
METYPLPKSVDRLEADAELTPREVYDELILYTNQSNLDSAHRPTLVMNGGQTGAGKTALTVRDTVLLADEPGGVVRIDWDYMRSLLPRSRIEAYHRLDPELAQHGHSGGSDLLRRYIPVVMQQAIRDKRNVHIDGILEPPESLEFRARAFHDAGYKVKVHVLMAHPFFSSVGRIARMASTSLKLQSALENAGQRPEAIAAAQRQFLPRYPDQREHDAPITPGQTNYQPAALRHAEKLLQEGIIDEIELWERGRALPTWQAESAGDTILVTQKQPGQPEEQSFTRQEYPVGIGAGIYESHLQQWTLADYQKLTQYIGPTRSMLELITLPQAIPSPFRQG